LQEIAMNTALNASIENRLAKEYVSVGQQVVVGTPESGFQSAYVPARARLNQLNQSRAAILNTQIDDGFRPFRVF
jgi:hypothetical protein